MSAYDDFVAAARSAAGDYVDTSELALDNDQRFRDDIAKGVLLARLPDLVTALAHTSPQTLIDKLNDVAHACYTIADAMLAARKQVEPKLDINAT